ADFREVIVFVDVNSKLNLLQFCAGWFLVLGVFRDVVSKLSKIDDLAHRRICRRRDLGQIEPEILSSAQRVLQFHDSELFAGGPQNDPDFASANPAVYTNLWLQIRSISSTAKRECTASPYSIYRNFRRRHSQTPRHSSSPRLRFTATKCSH